MSNLNNFKNFVKENPSLLKHVKSGDMTWQKFYEMYDLYGDKEDVWKEYLEVSSAAAASISTVDILSWLKNIDMDAVSENINSIKRVISVLQDFGKNSDTKEEYEPRPIYKHFED